MHTIWLTNSVYLLFNNYLSNVSSVGDTIVGTSNYASNKTDTITDLMGLRLNFLLWNLVLFQTNIGWILALMFTDWMILNLNNFREN